jgi:hypothetical protein
MEPRPDALVVLDRARTPGQDQECILEDVLDVMLLAEDTAANCEDHRTVTLDQDCECLRIIRGNETFQKLLLRHRVVPKVLRIRGMVADRNNE